MSTKFVPPKLDMGSGFAVAGSMKANQYKRSNKDTGTPSNTSSKRKLMKQKTVKDTIPLTLINLSKYFDWRRGQFDESPTLFKLASIIWLYLPKQEMNEYTVNFSAATDNSVVEGGGMNIMQGPPAIVTTSPKGEVLVMVENMKKLIEYAEKQFLLILYPYIDNCRFIEDATVQTAGGEHCTYWEIEGVEHLTHIAMDKYGIIYFTTGESVYRIMKTEGDMYLDNYEDIFTPSNDTSHITSLWRQNNDIFLTIQDWENESALDVYKIRPPKDKGVSTPDSPTGKRARSPSFGNRNRTRSRSNSGYGSDYGGGSPRSSGTANDSNEFVNKVRTFSLQFNSRIWQLGTMRFEKKFILSVGAAQMGNVPQLLQIGFKKKIKAMNLMGNKKNIIWPKSSPDEVPHTIAFHKQTKTWFCILPVTNKKYKDGARSYWVQFRLDKTKKKIIWQRLVEVPPEAKGGDWLHYDDVRDLLIGFSKINQDENEYVFRFLPDMTKHLWIDLKDDDDKKSQEQPGMQMQRSFRRTRKGSKEKPSLRRTSSGKNTPTMSKNSVSNSSTTSENNIKPSKAKKESKANSTVADNKKPSKPKKKKSVKNTKKDKDKKDKEKKDDKAKTNSKDDKSNKVNGGKRGSGKVDVKKIKPKQKKDDKAKQNGGGSSPPKDKIEAATNALSDVVKPVKPLKIEPVTSNSKKDKKEEKGKEETGPKTPKSPVNKYKRKRKVTNRKGGNTPTTRKGTKSNGSTPVASSSPRKNKKPVMDKWAEEDVMD